MADFYEMCSVSAYRIAGIGSSRESVNASIANLANKSGAIDTTLTEKYLYDESIFSQYLIMEAELRIGAIGFIAGLGSAEGYALPSNFSGRTVLSYMSDMVMLVTLPRIELAGLKPMLDAAQVETYQKGRQDSWKSLFISHTETQSPLPRPENWQIGLSRHHPTGAFFGGVADTFAGSLDLPPSASWALEACILARRDCLFKSLAAMMRKR